MFSCSFQLLAELSFLQLQDWIAIFLLAVYKLRDILSFQSSSTFLGCSFLHFQSLEQWVECWFSNISSFCLIFLNQEMFFSFEDSCNQVRPMYLTQENHICSPFCYVKQHVHGFQPLFCLPQLTAGNRRLNETGILSFSDFQLV